MSATDIRWVQRFQHYKNALAKLSEVATRKDVRTITELEKEGMIQRFEYTFELAWKTLQDLLEYKGYQNITGPAPVLEQALLDGYIEDEKQWRNMKKSRELTSHTYNSETANNIANNIIDNFYALFLKLASRLEIEKGNKQLDIFQ